MMKKKQKISWQDFREDFKKRGALILGAVPFNDSPATPKCFICQETLVGKALPLAKSIMPYSRSKTMSKVGQLLGQGYLIIVSEDDMLCLRCTNLINQMDKLEFDLEIVKKPLVTFLKKKYNISTKLSRQRQPSPQPPTAAMRESTVRDDSNRDEIPKGVDPSKSIGTSADSAPNNVRAKRSVCIDRFWQDEYESERDATQILISIIKAEKYQELLNGNKVRKSKVWEMIADEMLQRGAKVPAPSKDEAGKKCHQKWRNLEYSYLKYKESLRTGEKRKFTPKYFNDMDEAMSMKLQALAESSDDVPSSSNPAVQASTGHKHKLKFSRNAKESERGCKSEIEDHSCQLQLRSSLLEVQNKQQQELMDIFKTFVGESRKRKRKQSKVQGDQEHKPD